jgi:hypothetical protein
MFLEVHAYCDDDSVGPDRYLTLAAVIGHRDGLEAVESAWAELRPAEAAEAQDSVALEFEGALQALTVDCPAEPCSIGSWRATADPPAGSDCEGSFMADFFAVDSRECETSDRGHAIY